MWVSLLPQKGVYAHKRSGFEETSEAHGRGNRTCLGSGGGTAPDSCVAGAGLPSARPFCPSLPLRVRRGSRWPGASLRVGRVGVLRVAPVGPRGPPALALRARLS